MLSSPVELSLGIRRETKGLALGIDVDGVAGSFGGRDTDGIELILLGVDR